MSTTTAVHERWVNARNRLLPCRCTWGCTTIVHYLLLFPPTCDLPPYEQWSLRYVRMSCQSITLWNGLIVAASRSCTVRCMSAINHSSSPFGESLLQAFLSARKQGPVPHGALLQTPHGLTTTVTVQQHLCPDPPLFLSLTPRTILAFYFAHCDLEMESTSKCILTQAPFIFRLLERWYIPQEAIAVPLVQTLIDVGANFDISMPMQRLGGGGVRPLAMALLQRRLETAKIFIEAGADVSATISDDRRMTPLKCATEQDSSGRLVELLLEAGAPVEDPDVQGLTTLIYAVRFRNVAAISHCHRFGCDVNHGTNDGMTPMMFACKTEDSRVVAAMLDLKGRNGQRSVDLMAKNHRGQTALDIIAESDSTAAKGIEDTLRVVMGLPPRRRCIVS